MAMRYRVNESQKIQESVVDQGEGKKSVANKNITIKIKKKTLLGSAIAILLIAVGIGVLFSQTRKIDGTWIRVSDDNNLTGMVVRIENGQGVIVKSSSNNSLGYGFKEGLVKWNNIQKTGWGQYTFSDLVSDDNSATTYYDNSISKMEVSMDGKRLTLTVVSGYLGEPGRTGLYQEWEKK